MLTEKQRQIVELTSGRHLVLAPPGTGKTEMLTRRVEHALRQGIPPETMLCGTFTVRAAAEMAARIRAKLALPPEQLPLIGNLHHICHHFLSKNRLLPQGKQIADEHFKSETLADLRRRHKVPDELLERSYVRLNSKGDPDGYDTFRLERDIDDALSRTLARMAGVPDLLPQTGENPCLGTGFIRRLCDSYRALKERLFVIDFDDLLAEAYRALTSPDLPEGFIPYSWVQIDEVQDLNPLQWAIIDRLAAPDAVFLFFGDYEQSIYSFMGASVSLLAERAGSCTQHVFETNFRCKSYLLDLLTRYALQTLGAPLPFLPFPAPGNCESGAGHLRILPKSDLKAVAAEACRLLDSGESANVALLVQTNRTANELARCLTDSGTPFVKISGFEFSSRRLYRDLAAVIEVCVNPLARLAWSRLLRHFSPRHCQSREAARQCVAELFDLRIDPFDFLREATVRDGRVSFETIVSAAGTGRFVVFDTETTGLDLLNDHIVQLTGVEYIRGEPGRQLNLFLKSPIPMPPGAEAVHHISDAKLAAEGIDPAEGIRQFLAFAGDDLLVAHNLRYDKAMLTNACRRYAIPFNPQAAAMCDTLTLARRLHPGLAVFKLGKLLETFGLEGNNSHDALDDVLATGNLFRKLTADCKAYIPKQKAWLESHAAVVRDFFLNAADYFRGLAARLDEKPDLRREVRLWIDCALAKKLYTPKDCREMIREDAEDDCFAEPAAETQDIPAALAEPLDKLCDYLERTCANDPRSARQFFEEEWNRLSKLKEADLYPDDARLVISTIHKAKGRQFDTVIIPSCQESYQLRGSHRKIIRQVNGFPSLQVQRFGADRLENARLLYVGMSRAKRNLILATDSDRISPFLSPCLPCFTPGFNDFYLRLRENGNKLYPFTPDDLPARLYYISNCKQHAIVPPNLESTWLTAPERAIRDLAGDILSEIVPAARAERFIRENLNSEDPRRLQTVIRCIRRRGLSAYLRDLRKLFFLREKPDGIKVDIFRAVEAMLPQQEAVDALEDMVFCELGRIRLAAAARLKELGRPAFAEAVDGSAGDWERLGGLVSARARRVIDWRINNSLPGWAALTLLALPPAGKEA